MRCFLHSTLLLLASVAAVSGDDASNAMDAHVQDMVAWLRNQGGHFNEKLQIRRADPSDPTSYFGVFATESIQHTEPLMHIPASSMIRSSIKPESNTWAEYQVILCDLTHVLMKELKLGENSHFAPYVQFLLAQERGQIPATWTEPAKELLREVAFPFEDEHQLTDWIETDFEDEDCIESGNAFEQQALALTVQRGWANILIPIYDMMNHINEPTRLNTDNNSVYNAKGLNVWASRTIEAGEELLLTYDNCGDCDNNPEETGTQELLRDFGFVELYPRRFNFGGEIPVAIDTDELDGETMYFIDWLGRASPSYEQIEWMKEEHQRILNFDHEGTLAQSRDEMPENEWNTIFQYHQALVTALDSAIENAIYDFNAVDDEDDEKDDANKSGCDKDGDCAAPWIRYNDLNKEIQSSDDYYRNIYQCETLVFGIDDYDPVGRSVSHYQSIDYVHDPETKEMCFHLNGIFEQCASFRPHYHEMGVHFPARYLPQGLKRVLWIGGGDAMFLHEILKYNSLELAVGLELDQEVTRGGFKYLGAQPHWDNEKVQWWYGDASKSLLMLPEHYFGSFDMVLVDLPDDVLSSSVTKEMDVIGALSLLLKPDGIFVLNDLFFESVSEVFEHTVQVKFEDVPKICDQAFVLASNNIDFLRRNLTGHPVEDNLYIDPFDPSEDPFELVHDYRRNRDSDYKKLCKKSDQATKEVFAQEGSPGIFMAVEAEEVTMDLHSMKDVQDAVTEALEKEGFKVDSVVERTNASELLRSTSAETVLVLREGYVAIRTWPEQKYCAFDIHLWSSFEQHDAAKKAVVASVGGVVEKASSYRIVAGGMFGVSTWKDDAKVHGPQLDRFCDRSEAPGRDAPVNPRTVEVALEAGLRLVRVEEPITAAVICGKSEDCPTVDLLLGNDKVDQVIVVSKCPGLTPADERLENGLERIIACEKATLQTLQGSLKDGKLVQAVVVDGGASQLMGQIVLKILTGSKSSREVTILAPEMIAIATIVDEETESWRRNFLDEIRRDVVKLDPVFRAEILFNTTDSSMELGITSSDNEHFIQHLADAVASVNKESGLSVEVRRLHGGLWRAKEKTLMDDSEADEVFSLESYDRTAPMEQWKSQQPMAHQTLFQFETRPLRLGDKVEVAFTEGDQMYEGVVDWVNDDNTYYVKFIHSDFSDSVARSEIRKRYGSPNDEVLTAAQVKDSLKHALSFVQSNKQIEVHELTSAGDGSILIAFWPGGSILVMWDGRNHIDVNLFDFFESSSLPENLALHFKQHIHGLETILRDEQPRGFGRVVNFKRDLDSINPLWA